MAKKTKYFATFALEYAHIISQSILFVNSMAGLNYYEENMLNSDLGVKIYFCL